MHYLLPLWHNLKNVARFGRYLQKYWGHYITRWSSSHVLLSLVVAIMTVILVSSEASGSASHWSVPRSRQCCRRTPVIQYGQRSDQGCEYGEDQMQWAGTKERRDSNSH